MDLPPELVMRTDRSTAVPPTPPQDCSCAADLESEAKAKRQSALDAQHFGLEALCAAVLGKLSPDLLHSELAEVQRLVRRLQRRAEATPDPSFSWATADFGTPVF
jgi:hypothetical protein